MTLFIIIAISLAVSCVISFLISIGLILSHIVNSFWGAFLLSLGVQWFITMLWNYWISKKTALETEANRLAEELIKSVQEVTIGCAYCNTPNKINMFIGKENRFTCLSCNQQNLVTISLQSTRVTIPVTANETLKNLFEKLDNMESQKVDKPNTGVEIKK